MALKTLRIAINCAPQDNKCPHKTIHSEQHGKNLSSWEILIVLIVVYIGNAIW